jgi:hypothetical protein
MKIAISTLTLVTIVVAFPHDLDGARMTTTTTPVQQQVEIDTEYSCVVCHVEKRRAFTLGVHSERNIRCHDCHGGNPTGLEVATAHAGPDWIGTPDKLETIDNCASCHSDPDQMRQYGLPAGQLAEFRTSRHGLLLLGEGDTNAPTCTDCHDAHTILPPNDARSNVYPTNIVRTCSRCHEDESMMAQYGISTEQVHRYMDSAHGVALFDKENFSAPTCVDCHGSHAALPPQVVQIADVCGQCHVPVRRAFYEGPHGQAARDGILPGCTACHSNHGTERIPPDQIAATCTGCHADDSDQAVLGSQIEEYALHAYEELQAAEEAIHHLARAGHQTRDYRFRYQAAMTAYSQMDKAQHSLDIEMLEDLDRQTSSISRDIRSAEEVAAEETWEHKLILIPVWFFALSGMVLAWFKLRGLRKGEE